MQYKLRRSDRAMDEAETWQLLESELGAVAYADYDFERAIVGFLTLDQIYYYLTD